MYLDPLFFPMIIRYCRKSLDLGTLQCVGSNPLRFVAFHPTVQFSRRMSRVTPSSPDTRSEIKRTMPTISEVVGQSGSRYVIQQVLQEKERPTRRVYLARFALLSSVRLQV